MVAVGEGDDELPRALDVLVDGDVGHLLADEVGVDQDGLVPQELVALQVPLLELGLREALEPSEVLLRNPVPVLGRPEVLEVDRPQVQVLHVPREHTPEIPEVKIGRVDPIQRRPPQPVLQTCAQSTQVPRIRVRSIKERPLNITAVERTGQVQVLPEEHLELLVAHTPTLPTGLFGLANVLGGGHGFALQEDQLVDAW